MNDEPSERQKYIDKLEAKLRKAGKARRFLEHEDGGVITEYATEQINSLMKQIAGKALFDKPTDYSYAVGQLHAYQKLLTMLNAEANTDSQSINESLNAAKSDE